MTGPAIQSYVRGILGARAEMPAQHAEAEVFMPSNIALVKYWGKRPGPLNLPLVSSLSYTLDGYGSKTKIALDAEDGLTLNGRAISGEEAQKTFAFLDLFRGKGERYRVVSDNNIPTAAGVASSASGFAALTAAIVALKGWDLSLQDQSLLARLGSGSAARSFWSGTVLWHKGTRDDGMDSYAEPVSLGVEPFSMAVLLLTQEKKGVSSRAAMKASLETSPLAPDWPKRQQEHLEIALNAPDLATLGAVAEENAILMHDLIRSSQPPISFDMPQTVAWRDTVLQWRAEGVPVWFTQDAGPNLKLLFPRRVQDEIEARLAARQTPFFIV